MFDHETAAFLFHHNSIENFWRGADKLYKPEVLQDKKKYNGIVNDLCKCVRSQRAGTNRVKRVMQNFFASQGRGLEPADKDILKEFKPGISREAYVCLLVHPVVSERWTR